MTPAPRDRLATVRALAAGVLAFALTAPLGAATAQPATSSRESRADTPLTTVTARLDGARASLETSAPSVPAGSTFTYAARVIVNAPADYASIRFRLKRPTGRLIYQRTRILNDLEPGAVAASFSRGTDDLDLKPGVYPVELEVTVARAGKNETAVLESGLLVYDADARPLDVAFVARVGGQPLADPNGRFVADPGRFTRARDDVKALSTWVLSNPDAHVTLAVSPLLLEEWSRIADGYEFAGPEGVERVAADSTVANGYASTLVLLGEALDSGRLELLSTGYADPDLSALAAARLSGDVLPQYERGLSATFASLETTPSTGTAPAGGCIPPGAVRHLTAAGVSYAVVDAACARSGDSTPLPSAYRSVPGGLIVLVSDLLAEQTVRSGSETDTVAHAFGRLLDEEAAGPLVIGVDLGAGGADVDLLTQAADGVSAHPWARLSLAREVASRPKRSARLVAGSGTKGDPAGYWTEVGEARKWASALLAAIGEGEAEAVTAQRDSLIAQCSAWAGPDGTWAAADRGRAFSATAQRMATDVLDGVSLAVEPITLAGTRGDVPVTVRNRTDRTLAVRLHVSAERGARIVGSSSREVALGPRETFLEIPLDLSRAGSGDLKVEVLAGDVVLDSASVTVKASYLDRIATVGGVVVLLGVLLAFIIRRVRNAEPGPDTLAVPQAYTGPEATSAGRRRT